MIRLRSAERLSPDEQSRCSFASISIQFNDSRTGVCLAGSTLDTDAAVLKIHCTDPNRYRM
jgi:hypothetical protein